MSGEQSPPLTPREGGPEDGTALPKPDLSPLTNPTLGRNLGKWAQVYFTNPPETRDVALSELLRELETTGAHEAQKEADLQAPYAEATNNFRDENSDSASAVAPGTLSCQQCARGNAPDQWFCGYCGFPLRGTSPATPTDTKLVEGRAARTSPLVSSRMSEAQHTDLQWLRERSLASFRNRDTASHPFRSMLIIVFLLGLAGLFYYYWESSGATTSTIRAASRAKQRDSSHATPFATSQPAKELAVSNRERPARDEQISTPTSEVKPRPVRASLATEKAGLVAVSTDNQETASDATGQHELNMAATFLNSGQNTRDPSEAAKWLWKSVAKHNTAALLKLATLYEHGDGVSKSCDQAQVLLVAAAKRGSIEAGHQLKKMQASGCE